MRIVLNTKREWKINELLSNGFRNYYFYSISETVANGLKYILKYQYSGC